MTVLPDNRGSAQPAVFSWDVQRDIWDWSDEMYDLHGYLPGEVEPTYDLVLAHKFKDDRLRSERIMGGAGSACFRFSNHHRIVDAYGRERLVVAVGAAVARRSSGSDTDRHVIQGFVIDITAAQAPPVTALSRSRDATAALSRREQDVLALIAAGRSNDEIATELYVTLNTVKTYIRTAYRKIGAKSRSQAVVWVLARPEPWTIPPCSN